MGGGVKHVDVPSDSRDLWGGGSNMLMCRVIAEIYGGGGVKHVDVPSDSRDLWGGGQTC